MPQGIDLNAIRDAAKAAKIDHGLSTDSSLFVTTDDLYDQLAVDPEARLRSTREMVEGARIGMLALGEDAEKIIELPALMVKLFPRIKFTKPMSLAEIEQLVIRGTTDEALSLINALPKSTYLEGAVLGNVLDQDKY